MIRVETNVCVFHEVELLQYNEKFETLKTELLRNSKVVGVTASGQRLGNNFHQWGFKVKADTGILQITPSNVNVEYDYLKVYGIKLKDGRDFSKENLSDNGKAFIINESFAKELGLEETIGTPAGHDWYHNDSLGTIIGVAEDFNFNSLHHKINTLSMVVHPDWGYDEMSVKIDGKNVEAAIAHVKALWDKNITSYPFSYSFLDEHFAVLYRSDQQMSSVVAIMATLAILISCMGLFGLAAITTAVRLVLNQQLDRVVDQRQQHGCADAFAPAVVDVAVDAGLTEWSRPWRVDVHRHAGRCADARP